MPAGTALLVVAKAPVPGRAKTRLGRVVGMEVAADLAAAALLDTLAAGAAAADRGRRFVAMTGDLGAAARSEEIQEALSGWQVYDQRGEGFDERLVAAYADLPASGPVLQIGMDTPQVTAADLGAAAAVLEGHDAVLGPAEDGGWWVLGLVSTSDAEALRGVPMSVATTHEETRRALVDRGLRVASTTTMLDVDEVDDADRVAGQAPGTRFAAAWATARRARAARNPG